MKLFDSLNPFGNDSTDADDPVALIDDLESTLTDAIERRLEVRDELKQRLNEAKIKKERAEARMIKDSDDIEVAGGEVDAQTEVVEGFRNRIKGLNKQITSIRKRMPKLTILRTDVELLRDLESEGDWREHVTELMDELRGDDPVRDSSADEQLEALLTSIDDVASDPTPHSSVPSGVVDFAVDDIDEAHEAEAVTTDGETE